MAEALKTRTLASLYLAQGYPHRARRIVRELLSQSPDDPELRDLLRQIDDAARRSPEEAEVPPSSNGDVEPGAEHPVSVRETESPVTAIRDADTAVPPGASPFSRWDHSGETLTERARELGAAVVDHLTAQANRRLTRLLDRIRERRR